MKANGKRLFLLSAMLITGCSTHQPQVSQLHAEVGELSQHMRQLTRQASAVEHQGQLNSGSASGAWLLPQARTPVELQSQAGTLTLSLADIHAEGDGTRVTLTVRPASDAPLSALNADIEWGQLDTTRAEIGTFNVHSQRITLAEPLLSRRERRIALHLTLPPTQLGYLRIHNIHPSSGNAP